MHAQLMNSLKLQTDLRNAYQACRNSCCNISPSSALDTGQIRGFEALLRWNSRDQGLLKPDQFLSSIDTTGLLNSVECWVLRKASEQIARWIQQFQRTPPLFMSVNLSSKQLENPNLVELIEETLSEYRLDPDATLAGDLRKEQHRRRRARTIPRLQAIRSLGVHLCLDDFGTGYSTLGYFSRLPINVLKIDRSLISGGGHKSREQQDRPYRHRPGR